MTIWDDLRWSHILWRVGILFLLLLLGWVWYRSRKKRFLWSQVCLFIAMFASLEVLSWASLRWIWTDFEKPSHLLFRFNPPTSTGKPPFYGDYDPDFNRWRLPSDSVIQYRCQDSLQLIFRSNHLGLRDQDYPSQATQSRVVWLGDSFTEGVMVNVEDRASDIIERLTGTPQINMAIRSSSPINHYLIYKKLKSHYDHDTVVLGILPANDFEDYHPSQKITLLEYPRYRPYWKNSTQIDYSLNHLEQAHGSRTRYNRPDLVYATRDSLYRSLSFKEKCTVEWTSNSYIWSLIQGFARQRGFQTFLAANSFDATISPAAWQQFVWSFESLLKEASGKKVLMVLYPTVHDVLAYQKNTSSLLADHLQGLCKSHGIEFINTLPHFAKHPSPESLYVACDGHWNEAGEQYVASFLLSHPFFAPKDRR